MAYDRSAPTPNADRGLRINEQIRISPLRVVDANGEMLGIIPRDQAISLARERELDLVEVAPMERPPVCKIMDYGKFKFEQNKKSRKTKQHHTQVKEIRVRPRCGDADLDTKIRHAREFLENQDKVQLTVQFKGRELAHTEMGVALVQTMTERLADIAKVERAPTRDGRRVIAILAPR